MLRVSMTLCQCNDFRKIDAVAILFREIQCKGYFGDVFSAVQVKYARITIIHTCFIALTLAGSLGRCLNTSLSSLVFKKLPWDPANVYA